MMKKNIICLSGLTAFFLASCLTGCQRKDQLDPNNPVTISVLTYYNGAQQIAFDELVKEFNKTIGAKKGIFVEASTSGDLTELSSTLDFELSKDAAQRELPDIFSCYATTAYSFDKEGLLANLNEYFSEEELAEYIDAYIEEGKVGTDDALLFLPVAKSTEVMTLNKTDWEPFAQETGITPDDLTTWEGVTASAQKYYEWTDAQTPAPNDGKAMFGRDAISNFIIAGTHQLGFDLFEVDSNRKATVTMNEDALRKIWDNYYVPYISGYFTSTGRFASDDMKTGNIILMVGSSSGATYVPTEVTVDDEEPYAIETVTMAVPDFAGCSSIAIQQGAGMTISKSDSLHEKASAEFLKWFTDTDANTRFTIVSSYLPVKKEANSMEAIEKAAQDNSLALNKTTKDSIEVSLEECSSRELVTSQVFDNSGSCRTIINDALLDKAAEDREAVKNLISANGGTLKEAVAQYDTNENFSDWYQTLKTKLEETVILD
ncbi:MAG: extracellular solute-binding protein [Lachnospiraceae bacterium]|nr:extracellular solute-binding protein [Lachnospiraceae bacterium]